VASRRSLEPASEVRFLHSQPHRDSSIGRAAVSEAACPRSIRGPGARFVFRPSSKGLGHESTKLEIGVRVAGGGPLRRARASGRTEQRSVVRLARSPAVYRVRRVRFSYAPPSSRGHLPTAQDAVPSTPRSGFNSRWPYQTSKHVPRGSEALLVKHPAFTRERGVRFSTDPPSIGRWPKW
jgi:hypothetical protein